MSLSPAARRVLPEAAACLLLFALALLFHWPESDLLHSHYTTMSQMFERSGSLVNPAYTDHFQEMRAEAAWPLATLAAHGWTRLFHSDMARALLFFHSTFILLSLFATYWANRLFFSRACALVLTILLLFDRVLLPLTRGLGLTWVPLLLPLILFALHSLARTQDLGLPFRKRVGAAAAMAVCLGAMLALGGHETLFAIASLGMILCLLALEWVGRSRGKRPFPAGPTRLTLIGVSSGIAMAAAAILLARAVVPAEQDRTSIAESFGGGYVGTRMVEKLQEEPEMRKGHRARLFRAAFVEGRFLTLEPGVFYGRMDEFTFLYPGRGFNGIIPLAIIPGFLLGVILLAGKLLALMRQREGDSAPSRRDKYLLLFLLTLLIHFAAILCLTATPKPSRFSLSVYAILTCGVYGYIFLFSLCRRAVERWLRRRSWPDAKRQRVALWAAVLVVLFPLALCLETRILKNYRDLQDYVGEYWIQVRTKAMEPVLYTARNAFASKNVYVTYYWKNHPEQGLLLRYRPLDNLKMYSTLEEAGEIDPDGIYFIWQDLGRRGSHFRVYAGQDLTEATR